MNVKLFILAASVGLIAGCNYNDSDDEPKEYGYTVSVKNLTANQPLSPLAVMTHDDSFRIFTIGSEASVALEELAEAGQNSSLLSMKDTDSGVYGSYSGAGVILPGSTDEVAFVVDVDKASQVSVASMFVNTNDAFVGETGVSIDEIGVGESISISMTVWDAGTEGNSETAASIPGPAAGGEGFNSARDDDDKVGVHPGVVSLDDGLTGSALNASHRFLNPGATLTITRTE